MHRFEKKYLLPVNVFLKLKNLLQNSFSSDAHANAEGYYHVSSLYFDKADLRCYYDKINGELHRYKFRLRSYAADLNGTAPIFLEHKVKKENLQIKYKYPASDKLINQALAKSPVDLTFFSGQGSYLPLLQVSYKRMAFNAYNLSSSDRGSSENHLRINFDYDIFFKQPGFSHSRALIVKNKILTEIKSPVSELPNWLNEFLNEHAARDTEFSKYVECMNGVRHEY